METELSYDGSVTIGGVLMNSADIAENERVQVVNLNNGARFETYVIRGEDGSGMICTQRSNSKKGYERL